jgi:hypothetical protein
MGVETSMHVEWGEKVLLGAINSGATTFQSSGFSRPGEFISREARTLGNSRLSPDIGLPVSGLISLDSPTYNPAVKPR